MTLLHLIVALFLLPSLQPSGKKDPPPSAAEIRDVREMLRVDDQMGGEQRALIQLGERVFPIFRAILVAKDVQDREISRMFGTLAEMKADRSQFLEHVIAGLSNESAGVRGAAVQLLAQIGSTRDTAPIVALLSDKEWTNSISAAKTLAAIGDRRALAAVDIWLNSSSPRQHDGDKLSEQLRKHVTKYRDELRQRLEKEKKSPGK